MFMGYCSARHSRTQCVYTHITQTLTDMHANTHTLLQVHLQAQKRSWGAGALDCAGNETQDCAASRYLLRCQRVS